MIITQPVCAQTPSQSPNQPSGQAPGQPQEPTQKTVWVAHALRKKTSAERIQSLEFGDAKFPVYLVSKDGVLKPTITIEGKFLRPGWRLFIQGSTPVEVSQATSMFEIHLHLRAKVSELSLVAVGPNDAKETETAYIYAPEAMEFKVVSAWDQLLLSAGSAFLSYTQSGYGEYQSISALVSARYVTPEQTSRFGLLGNLDMSFLTFVSSPIERGPQLLEAKIDGTMVVKPDPEKRKRHQILAGMSYLTMFANGSPFGFSNLIAPEIGYRGRYILSPIAAIVSEVRYVALGPPTLSFDQQGIWLGIGWSRLLEGSRRVELGFSYSGYAFRPDGDQVVRTHQLAVKFGLSI